MTNRGIEVHAGDAVLALSLAAFLLVGLLVLRRRHAHPIGLLLLAEGVLWEGGLLCQFAGVDERLFGWIWAPAVAGVACLLMLFPDGRLPSRRWRPVAYVVAASAALPLLSPAAGVLIGAGMLGAAASLVARYRRAGGIERRQIAWLVWAAAVVLTCSAAGTALGAAGVPEHVTACCNVAPLALLPLAIGAAVLRHRLYNIELVLSRTLVGAGLAAFAALVYLVAVVAAGELVGRGTRADAGLATLATALIALAFQPLRVWLERASARLLLGRAEPAPAAEPVAEVQLCTLGGFRVIRAGEPLGAAAWQSKKARTLLKILASRRGRPVARDELMELLWPGEPRDKLANRLSVALTTLRGVLDPGKERPPDHFVRSGEGAVALDLARVGVDVERYLGDVDAGLAAERAGRHDDAATLLRRADRRYAGDFLEEDRYEDWAAPLREELRAARGSALRALARAEAVRGDADAAVRAHLRVLEGDPFDAPAHLDLVRILQRSGHHGEALHRYREYVRAMREVGVAPAPLPV